jgi:hypothetical protein
MSGNAPERPPLPEAPVAYSREIFNDALQSLATRLDFVERTADQYIQAQRKITRTATTDGSVTGTIPSGYTCIEVASDDANKIIVLPAPIPGTVLRLFNGGTGYELRSSDPATVSINGGSGSNAESAIPANTLVTLVCTSSTTWIGQNQSSNGTISATQVAA